jgi:hypothetical protein
MLEVFPLHDNMKHAMLRPVRETGVADIADIQEAFCK